jgi:hypothetical protein
MQLPALNTLSDTTISLTVSHRPYQLLTLPHPIRRKMRQFFNELKPHPDEALVGACVRAEAARDAAVLQDAAVPDLGAVVGDVRESEAAAKALLDAGFTTAPDEASADIIIVNSCSVRQKAEDKALGKLGLLCATKRERPNRIVGLMGCMAQRLGKEIFKHIPTLDFAIGTRCADRVVPAVMAAIHGEHTLAMSDLHAKPDAPTGHVTEGAFSAFVTILLGCNRRCTYCIVPDVRGDEWSRPARDILKEIEYLRYLYRCVFYEVRFL